MDESAETETAFLDVTENAFDHGPVTESDRGTRGVHHQLGRHIAGELGFVAEQDLFEFLDAVKRGAVRHFSSGINGQRVMKFEFLPDVTEASHGFHRGVKGPVVFPPRAHDVKILQGEAWRIDVSVT
ncbi:MAG: hypothetical protein ABIP85_10975 [Chthoniobacteraceae bacterium]